MTDFADNLARVPFHFWSAVFFALGCAAGSFLNVCIYRVPRGMNVALPPSHCPACEYRIPLWHNVPLLSWLLLRGRCANCGAGITPRYLLVELLTGLAFLAAWLHFGHAPALALVVCLMLAGLIVASAIDFEHFIIPDGLNYGGMIAGVVLSGLLPQIQGEKQGVPAVLLSLLGVAVGAGSVYAVVRLGKLLFGRQKVVFAEPTRVIFGEESLVLPTEEIPYPELFYRHGDAVECQAERVELVDRSPLIPAGQPARVRLQLRANKLQIGAETLAADTVPCLEVRTRALTLPREAMGLGDVKFLAAIGAFLGWQGALFCLFLSAVLGAGVGLLLIALGRRAWSQRLPYGPYIAVAAVAAIFFGAAIARWRLG